jgi:hypothetical protein
VPNHHPRYFSPEKSLASLREVTVLRDVWHPIGKENVE